MSNLIAVGAHCNRGDEVILGDKAHIFVYEGAGASGTTQLLLPAMDACWS